MFFNSNEKSMFFSLSIVHFKTVLRSLSHWTRFVGSQKNLSHVKSFQYALGKFYFSRVTLPMYLLGRYFLIDEFNSKKSLFENHWINFEKTIPHDIQFNK